MTLRTATSDVSTVSVVPLCGLDGSNPLAFLAALGVMQLLSMATASVRGTHGAVFEGIRMSWASRTGSWLPSLHGLPPVSADDLVQALSEALTEVISGRPFRGDDPPALGGKIKLTPSYYRVQAAAACRDANRADRQWADWIGALATETRIKGKAGDCLKTTLDFTAGQQPFLDMARAIVAQASAERLTRCLFSQWHYADVGESLRWDPIDEKRRYALSAIDPTNAAQNPIRTELGANALAFAALPMLPVVEGRSLLFTQTGESMRWPLWSGALTVGVVRSLLASPMVHQKRPEASLLRASGIAVVMESPVVLPAGYYRNFTPARRIG